MYVINMLFFTENSYLQTLLFIYDNVCKRLGSSLNTEAVPFYCKCYNSIVVWWCVRLEKGYNLSISVVSVTLENLLNRVQVKDSSSENDRGANVSESDFG